MLSGQILDLICLVADDFSCMLKLGVDDFLVFDIDQWAQEDDAGEEERQAPERKELDQVVGQEGGEEGLEVLGVFVNRTGCIGYSQLL